MEGTAVCEGDNGVEGGRGASIFGSVYFRDEREMRAFGDLPLGDRGRVGRLLLTRMEGHVFLVLQ